MREFFTIAIFKIKADIRMNKTTLNSQKEKHSMLSLRRATSVALPGLRLHLDFYPRSPCGERRPRPCRSRGPNRNFYPRSPCGERQFVARLYMYRSNKFLSTLSLRRATRSYTRPYRSVLFLSTLSLRRATGKRSILYTPQEISIHALLAESDIAKFAFMTNLSLFLSTLSLRRATQQKCGDRKAHVNFYPRSPCGERRFAFSSVTLNSNFYPRSPCGERRKY